MHIKCYNFTKNVIQNINTLRFITLFQREYTNGNQTLSQLLLALPLITHKGNTNLSSIRRETRIREHRALTTARLSIICFLPRFRGFQRSRNPDRHFPKSKQKTNCAKSGSSQRSILCSHMYVVCLRLERFTYILWYIGVYISRVGCSQCFYIRVSSGVFAVGLGVHAPEASDPETCNLGAKGPNDPATQ